jgi:hypothetical protein
MNELQLNFYSQSMKVGLDKISQTGPNCPTQLARRQRVGLFGFFGSLGLKKPDFIGFFQSDSVGLNQTTVTHNRPVL